MNLSLINVPTLSCPRPSVSPPSLRRLSLAAIQSSGEIPTGMFFLLALVCLQAVACQRLPEVTIGQGTVRGVVQKTINGREFEAFLGIPYANPPVGQNRFK
ncbi:hypothetical protein GE061_002604, partial [Apolygus lucorum]